MLGWRVLLTLLVASSIIHARAATNRRTMPVATIYTRCMNPPYTEGHIAIVRSMKRAIDLSGWRALVLNLRYAGESSVNPSECDGVSPVKNVFEVGIPGIKKETILHSPNIAYPILASVLESLASPILFRQEVRAKTSLVHLVNCFKLPRAFLRLITRVPVLVHFYETPRSFADNLPLPVDAFVASSRRIAKALKTLHGGRLRVFTIPPAVDTDLFHTKVGPKRKVGLYIGNISAGRFPNELLEIFRQILAVDPDVSFRLIAAPSGANVARAHDIVSMCKSLGIKDKVSLSLRNITDADKLAEYTSAKFLIFAPSQEWHAAVEPPLTVLEAIASGLPVLATDTHSIDDAVISGKNGYVVREGYANLVSEALHLLQADEERWLAWSNEARRMAEENFSISRTSNRLAHLHSALLEN